MTSKPFGYSIDPDREPRLLFCQVGAFETAIYITEVVRKYGDAWIENQVREASFET